MTYMWRQLKWLTNIRLGWCLLCSFRAKNNCIHCLNKVTLKTGKIAVAVLQTSRKSTDCNVDIQENSSFCWQKCLCPSKFQMVKTKEIKKIKAKTLTRWNQTPVGARRLMKAILLRHILLKKTGQAGFMMKCSRRIRSSVNKVLWWKQTHFKIISA